MIRRQFVLVAIVFLLPLSAIADTPVACSSDSGKIPPAPFEVGDGNDYGGRVLELTVPAQCECDGTDCTPCPIVIGFHGYAESGSSPNSWKSRLEAKGAAAGFISLYPTGDNTTPNSFYGGLRRPS